MAKVCKQCGAQLEDNVLFCDNCGTKQDEEVSGAEAKSSPLDGISQKTGMPSTKIVGIVAVVVVVLIVLLLIKVLFGGGYKGAIKDYYSALQKGNTKKLIKVTYPKDSREDIIDDLWDMDIDDYYDAYDEVYDTFWEGLKDEGKTKLSYEIKTAEKLDKLDDLKSDVKDMNIKDLDDFIDIMDEMYEDYDFDADKIKQCYAVEVKYTLEVDGDKAAKDTSIIFVYKYRGDWYIFNPYPSLATFLEELDEDDYEDVIEDTFDAIKDELN